jgi:transcriptional regulator with XRE-family HTH domain
MDFCDPDARRLVSKAIGEELRRARESRGWSRAQFVARLPSGIGERTLLSYEHGTRELAVLRLLELCASLETDPTGVLSFALQRAKVLLENMDLQIDLHALLDNHNPTFRPIHQWARNKMNRHPDGIATLAPTAVRELADFIGCAHDELTHHLARFIPDAEYE